MKCTKEDCFNCKHPDCINDYVRKPHKYTQYDREYGKKKEMKRGQKEYAPLALRKKQLMEYYAMNVG